MAQDFAKVYPGLFKGSMADTPPFAKLLLIAMLLEANHEGVVEGPPTYWSGFIGVSVDDAERALAILQESDPDSRTPDEDGRRLIALGGYRWKIVNWEKYYEMNVAEQRREKARIRKQRQRDRERAAKPAKPESKRPKSALPHRDFT